MTVTSPNLRHLCVAWDTFLHKFSPYHLPSISPLPTLPSTPAFFYLPCRFPTADIALSLPACLPSHPFCIAKPQRHAPASATSLFVLPPQLHFACLHLPAHTIPSPPPPPPFHCSPFHLLPVTGSGHMLLCLCTIPALGVYAFSGMDSYSRHDDILQGTEADRHLV